MVISLKKSTIPYPPWGTKELWSEANSTLHYIIENHYKELQKARDIAERLHAEYQLLFPAIENLSTTTCPKCKNPCCLHAKPYFDFRDLIYLHLSNEQIPEMQTIADSSDQCRYITHVGCSLNRSQRPWICTWYICPSQLTIISTESSTTSLQIPLMINKTQKMRYRLEKIFLQSVS
jgi:hypothetical protein